MCVIWWRSSHVLGSPPGLHHAVLGLAEQVQPALGQKVQRQRQSGQPVGQNAVVDVAAGGVVAGQRRGLLPGLAPAARILVVGVGQRLAAGQPESLHQKKRQHPRRDALRQIEAKAAKHAKPVGHRVRRNLTSLNVARGSPGSRQRPTARCYAGPGQMSTIYTIGHSAHTSKEFEGLLLGNRIEVVVDVRSAPYSCYAPQFDQELLQKSSAEAGIKYLFLGRQSGGRPASRAYYDAQGPRALRPHDVRSGIYFGNRRL